MAYDEVLAARVRDRLQGAPGVAERKMFGGLVFMTAGHLTVGVYGDDLLVNVGAADVAAAVAEPGAARFEMAGRPMRAMIRVAGEALDDPDLERWIARARAHVATLPPK
jgi:TfoX/Sxy family transcriptional regulator of competence genes